VQLACDAAALFILQVKQTRGELAQTVIGRVELDGALLDLLLQLALGPVQSGAVAADKFTDGYDDRGSRCECKQAHHLWDVGNTQRIFRRNE
jgi:hypothetical protein